MLPITKQSKDFHFKYYLRTSVAVTVMLCHISVSRSNGLANVIFPSSTLILNCLSRSVCRSMKYLQIERKSSRIAHTQPFNPTHTPTHTFWSTQTLSHSTCARCTQLTLLNNPEGLWISRSIKRFQSTNTVRSRRKSIIIIWGLIKVFRWAGTDKKCYRV